MKGQSNLEIAGTPRNALRDSLIQMFGLGLFTGYQTQANSECLDTTYGSETACDKVRSREGNSPDRQLRSPNTAKCEMMCYCPDSQEVGLEAAIPLKSA